jgi:type I restriction enzyme S subunit
MPDDKRVAFGDVVVQRTKSVDPTGAGLARYVAIEHLDPFVPVVEHWGEIAEGTTFTREFVHGDVLFSKRRPYQRKGAKVSFRGVCSGDLLVFAAKPEYLLPELLPYLVQSQRFFEHAVATSAGSLSPRTKWSELAKFEFLLPALSRQRRIAAQLDEVERCRKSWIHVGEAARLSRAIMSLQDLFDGRCPMVPLKDLATIRNGTTPSRKREDYWEGGKVPWLPTGKVHDREIAAADEFVTELALQQCSLRLVPAGSVLVAMIGQGKTRGTAAFLQFDATINQNFAAVIPGADLDGRYLFHLLESSYEKLRRMSQGSSQGALNCRLVGEFQLPLLPLDQQRALAARCDSMGEASAQAFGQAERLLRLGHSLTDAMLVGLDV